MKVLQINSVCGVGSTGRIATDLYKVLEKQGHECKIAYGRGTAPEGIDSIKIGSKLDNYMHVFKTRVFDKHGFGSVNATKKFIEEVKEYDPDIIHLHNIHGYYINIEILFNYLKDANKPVIWTLHDCWAFTGHCSYFDYAGCDKWKDECNKCIQKQVYPASNIIDNSKSNYKNKKELFTGIKNMTVVTPSIWLSKLVKESFLKEYPVEVINNGINLSIFKNKLGKFKYKYGIENKYMILGVANLWDRRKGLEIFIDLSKIINNEYSIVLIGLSENQIKSLPDNIIGITKTNDIHELVDIYSEADCFMNPSQEETMGLVTIESLACGTPAIVSNKTALPEMVDSSCGVIVEDYSAEGFMKAIEHIRNGEYNKDYCEEFSKNFNMKDKFNEYIYIYKNIIKK